MNKIASISFDSLSKEFAGISGDLVSVFSDFNLNLTFPQSGEIVCVLGPSGSGKTTMLKLISGIEEPTSGRVHINSIDPTLHSPSIRTVPQGYTCFPWLTAVENVQLGLQLSGRFKKDLNETALAYLKQVGLENRAEFYPKELSGGMKQRVAIARTLATEPELLLLDEPFSSLDFVARSEMQDLVVQLWLSNPRAIVFVTHDITEAILMASRIIVLPRSPITKALDCITVPFAYPRTADVLTQKESIQIISQIRNLLSF